MLLLPLVITSRYSKVRDDLSSYSLLELLLSRYARSIRDVIMVLIKKYEYVNPPPFIHTSIHPSIH